MVQVQVGREGLMEEEREREDGRIIREKVEILLQLNH